MGSYLLFDFHITPSFVVGVCFVIGARDARMTKSTARKFRRPPSICTHQDPRTPKLLHTLLLRTRLLQMVCVRMILLAYLKPVRRASSHYALAACTSDHFRETDNAFYIRANDLRSLQPASAPSIRTRSPHHACSALSVRMRSLCALPVRAADISVALVLWSPLLWCSGVRCSRARVSVALVL
eukprot:6187552-Pleurochrysis_carterae.AAC.3